MKFRELLRDAMNQTYFATETMFDMVEGDDLDWKPSTGENWMTTGQLLMHASVGCGFLMKGFITGDWSMPDEATPKEKPANGMMHSAEQLPSVESVKQAKDLLAKDKELGYSLLEQCSDEDLDSKKVSAPWDPREMALGVRLLEMVNHLNQHKGQLFYYHKLQGKPVNTMHLWGMGES